jgi:nucleoside 2-deoxyribosyltransferase
MKIYTAYGWFSEDMIKAANEIDEVINELGLREVSFMPRHDTKGFFSSEGADWDGVFNANVHHIKNANLMIASTVDKDMGTIWECGYAAANNIPIIYYNPFMDSRKNFNLMLAKSGLGVCISKQELKDFLSNIIKYQYNGEIE